MYLFFKRRKILLTFSRFLEKTKTKNILSRIKSTYNYIYFYLLLNTYTVHVSTRASMLNIFVDFSHYVLPFVIDTFYIFLSNKLNHFFTILAHLFRNNSFVRERLQFLQICTTSL